MTTAVFDALVGPIRADVEALAARGEAAAIRDRIVAREMAPEDRAAIEAAFDRLFPVDAFVAVRSSAIGEDSARDSYAGQMDTFLYVRRADVVETVKRCFASTFSDRALAYRALRGAAAAAGPGSSPGSGSGPGSGPGSGLPSAAAVVQEILPADVAGVLFTREPTEGRDEVTIAAGLGLGEGIVSDKVETDTFWVARDLAPSSVRERTSEKRSRVVFDAGRGSGTTVADVPEERRSRPALSREQVVELARLGLAIEGLYAGVPQDVEWAIDASGRIFVLQARPITTGTGTGAGTESGTGTGTCTGTGTETGPGLAAPGDATEAGTPSLGGPITAILDNSNVVESYPGITTPLTYSFARRGYEIIFRETVRAVGVSGRAIVRNQALFENMIALVRGRIYYNILNWYRLQALVPGYAERNRTAWEEMIGVRERFVDTLEEAPRGLRGRLGRAAGRARFVLAILRRFLLHDRDVRRFGEHFERVRRAHLARPLDALTAHELCDAYDGLVRDLLFNWHATTINDFFAMKFYAAVKAKIAAWSLDDAGTLANDLLCGETGMESVEPVRSLLGIAARVRAEPALAAVFAEGLPDDAVWRDIRERQGEPFAAFRRLLDEHLDRFGDRSIEELKLETPNLRDAPAFLVSAIRSYAAAEGLSVAGMEAREAAIRRSAEEAVAARLSGSPLRRALFRFVLRHCRKAVRDRENMRLARSRAYGLVKGVFRRLGGHLARAGALDDPADVFWLAVEEVIGFVRGSAVTRDLRSLVRLRRAEVDAFRREPPPPERIVVRGPVASAVSRLAAENQGGEVAGAGAVADARTGADELRGLGCCPGVVRAKARVIADPSEAVRAGVGPIRGEVLVAKMTDPGWVFLMVAAGGIVVEKGSVLSHTAIIGRELGIPTIVGVAGATSRIRTGDEVEMDGRAGTVRVLTRAPGPPGPS